MNILEEADSLINGDRAQNYGDVSENFERIAKMWGAYRDQFFDRHDVAQMMILVKVARQSSGYHRDSNVDIAGYAALDEQVHDALDVPAEDVFFIEHMTEPVKPRVWQQIYDVPSGVRFTDRDGDVWEWNKYSDLLWDAEQNDVWVPWADDNDIPEDLPPFTEVVE